MEDWHRKENSRPYLREKTASFGKEDAMMILGIPNIVVLEPVHVRLQRAISIDVHVGNEELCAMPSMSHFCHCGPTYGSAASYMGHPKPSSTSHQLAAFLKKCMHTLARRIRQNSLIHFLITLTPKPWSWDDIGLHYYDIKNPPNFKIQSV